MRVSSASGTTEVVTGADGTFEITGGSGEPATLTVDADGFATDTRQLASIEGTVTVVLTVAPLSHELTVTAERAPVELGETAASVRLIGQTDLAATSAQSIDGTLRQVPGFQLFRRNDSRYANPTTQGASLRGLSASGTSRVAVLADGTPADDPFGGWIQWDRFPRVTIDRLEAVRGGGSGLYGSQSLGGVVNIVTVRPAGTPMISLETSGGNLGTGELSATASSGAGPWSGRLSGDVYHTNGYIAVAEDERGPVDTRTDSAHSSIDLQLQRTFGDAGRAFVRGTVFSESRDNGTPLQTNATTIRSLTAGFDWNSADAGSFNLRVYGGDEGYDQSFSAINADRTAEALTRIQRVPIQQLGVSATWVRALSDWGTAIAGLDLRNIRGASDEIGYFGGEAVSASGSGGRQSYRGAFGSLMFDVTRRLQITAGVRFDWWRNYRALAAARLLDGSGASTVRDFDDRSESAVSPRMSILFRVTPSVTLNGSAYRAFRAPTLNELYRGFRVGNVVTLANSNLLAERLTGGEGGVAFEPPGGRVSVRANGFWSVVTRPVANVTLSSTPELITRQRANLGRTRSRGIEVDAVVNLTPELELSGGYTLLDATVLEFADNPLLVGKQIPQVPLNSGTVQLRYIAPQRWTLGVQARFAGNQYDDDLNTLPLGGYGVVDVFASRSVGHGLELFGAIENLLDSTYDIGRTPVTTVGAPFFVRGGIRLSLWGR